MGRVEAHDGDPYVSEPVIGTLKIETTAGKTLVPLAPDGTPIGIGRFVRLRETPDAADVALTVVDDQQGKGIGTVLIQALAVVARRRGIAVLHFDVLPENEPMLTLLRSLGASSKLEDGIVHAILRTADVGPPEVLDGDLGRLADRLAVA